MSGWIQRIDRSSVTLSSRAEMNRRLCATQFNMPDPDVVWVVAVVGEVRQPRGVIDMGLFECGLIAFDAFTGDAVMMTAGALATCAPYFKDSLVPPDAAVVGPSQPYDNGVGRWFRFSPTRPARSR